MAAGYTGKILVIDLTSGSVEEELLPEATYRNFIGGAGLGARILYERMKPNVDPLGSENMLGFIPGLLSGTQVPMASKCSVVTKSPLTDTWGDANSGGFFGRELKAAGYDAIFFTGLSAKPVYLWVQDGRAEIRDATHLWGKDTSQTEEIMHREIGDKQVRIARIGPAGESLSLIASVVFDRGRVAARSGVGAVMGAKKLKAVAVRGTRKPQIANITQFNRLRKDTIEHLRDMSSLKSLSVYGTTIGLLKSVPQGVAPLKNWSLMGAEAFPDHTKIAGENILKYQLRKSGCGNCPVNCGGIASVKEGPYTTIEGRRPEYETIAAFGLMCLNSNAESIIRASDICERYGIDTMSAGATIAFAMECYERGIIGKEETGGIELTWGNAPAMVAMLEQMVRREGLGEVLADGVARAAMQIGRGAEKYAMHVHGQEVGFRDSRIPPIRGLGYISNATPGRHMPQSASTKFEKEGVLWPYSEVKAPKDEDEYARQGKIHALAGSYSQAVSDSGVCYFAISGNIPLVEFISAVTGWDFTVAEAITVGKRIMTLRQAFNIREGLKAKDFSFPERLTKPPTVGSFAGHSIDFNKLRASYHKAMGWDAETGYPSKQCLIELGLQELVGILP